MDRFVNVDLLRNPLNWLIVFFMVFVFMVPLALLNAKLHPGA